MLQFTLTDNRVTVLSDNRGVQLDFYIRRALDGCSIVVESHGAGVPMSSETLEAFAAALQALAAKARKLAAAPASHETRATGHADEG